MQHLIRVMMGVVSSHPDARVEPRGECRLSMKHVIGAALGMVLVSVSVSYGQTPPAVSSLSPSMILENFSAPFVTSDFAERLALLVVEEKYPKDTLVASGVKEVMDRDGAWWVTVNVEFPSASPLRRVMGPLLPKQLTIQIRKTNAEIVSIS